MAERSTISSLAGARIHKVERDTRAPGFLVFYGWRAGYDGMYAPLFSIPDDQIFDADENLFAVDR